MPITTEAADRKTLEDWKHHWKEEADAAHLYRVLAAVEPDPKRADVYSRFAAIEDRHVQLWAEVLQKHGITVGAAGKPSMFARSLAWVARKFGPGVLLTFLLRREGQEVKGYLKMHEQTVQQDARDTALTLAHESAEHAEGLRVLANAEGEPWHNTESGGFLRNVVYGFNDGLTANFGLVAGVIGASATGNTQHAVLVAGFAGLVADALSMASSGYLAAKSEQEVYAHEIEVEKQEIEMMPEVEEEELALIYETRGVDREQARKLAHEVMRSPQRALAEKVREELKIGEAHTTPVREGVLTGFATAIGAFLPVFPFMFASGAVAVWLAFSIAMACHFGVGAARSLFTGRSIFRSGLDMFVVGLGVAAAGYVVGDVIERLL